MADKQPQMNDEELIWFRKFKNRAEGGKFWGGILIAVVFGWNAFTGGVQSFATWLIGGK